MKAAKKTAKVVKKAATRSAAIGGASKEIDAKLAATGDWRGEALGQARALILEADGAIVEDVKWRKPTNPGGVPVWERDGLICTGEIYKDKVKLTFAHGAALSDPMGLFNASLEAGTRRAIDLREGERLKPRPFKALVRAAVAINRARAKPRPSGKKRKRA